MLKHYLTQHTIRNVLFGALVIAIIVVSDLRMGNILADPFHHGEFFASTSTLKFGSEIDFSPFTIHGALDYLPALLVSTLYQDNELYLPTAFSYRLLKIISACVLLLVFFEITRTVKQHRYLMLATFVLVIPNMVSYKDLFLLISIYLFLLLQAGHVNPKRHFLLQLCLGIALACGVYWSFDRGIAATISLGLAIAYAGIDKRSQWFTLVVFGIALLLISQIHPVLSISHYIDNLSLLLQTSTQWSYGWQKIAILLTLYALLFNFLVFITVFLRIPEPGSSKITPVILALLMLQLFYIKIGTNRADLPHVLSSFWPPLLTLFFVYHESKPGFYLRGLGIMLIFVTLVLSYLSGNLILIAFAGLLALAYVDFNSARGRKIKIVYQLVLLGLIGTTLYFITSSAHRGAFQGAMSIRAPVDNTLASPPGIRWVSHQLMNAKTSCVFDLSNNGLINGIVQLPTCTPYSYPVYAGPNQEKDMLDHLRKTKPSAIVYSSTIWSYNIDGRSMKERFPAIDAYILATYPRQQCNEEYCIRFLR